ncbi:MAG: hypothetical protein WB711_18350 [Terriglobales bacterium]
MKRILVGISVLIAGCVTIIACGSNPYGNTTTTISNKPSGLAFRVFISNPLYPTTIGTTGPNVPVLNIVNAAVNEDILSLSVVSLTGSSAQPGLMALAPNLQYTLVYSQIGNTITVVDNAKESVATVAGGTTSVPPITLPGLTESMAVSPFATAAYVAVPTAPVFGQAPGAVQVLNLLNGSTTASIPIPGAHFVVCSPDGNHLLVFSDNSDTVTVISTASIGTNTDPRSYITGFDRPVWGIFTGNSSAFVMNCGAQCGGKAAGVSVLNLGASSASSTTPVPAATYGLLNNSTLYVAGTPTGSNTCAGTTTAATTCGRLSVIDTASMTVTGSAVIADGYHDRMQISQNGQLYIGSHTCTNINVSGGEVRGCLSIFNTNTGRVLIAQNNGDVTGLQQIRGRDIVYVIQNGALQIYDTDTNQLQVTPGDTQNNDGQVDIVGQLYDVKLVN